MAAERAIALAPDSADGYWARGGLRRGLTLDPLSARAWRQLALLELDLGRLAEAKQAAQHLAAILPNGYLARSLTGQIALAEGRYADALTEFRKDDDGSAWKLIGGAMAEYSLGHAAASQAALDELIRQYAATLAYQIAGVYAWRGERDRAFEWLERAYRQHDGGMSYLRHDRFLAPLRSDPRHAALLKKLSLAS